MWLVILASTLFLAEVQSCGQHVNPGCHPSWWPLDVFWLDDFKDACMRHEQCYNCGREYGISKLMCDSQLSSEIKGVCDTDSTIRDWLCGFSGSNISIKRITGQKYQYKYSNLPDYCTERWVRRCLPR